MSTVIKAQVGAGRSFVPVRLPKGRKALDSTLVRALDNMEQRVSTAPGCVVVFFRKKGGGHVAAQRCDNRSLSTKAKARWNRIKGKKVCRAKGGAKKGKFIRCR